MFSLHAEGTRSSRTRADGCNSTQWGNQVPRYHQGVVDLGRGVTPGSSVPFPAAGTGLCQRQGQQQRWMLGMVQSGNSYTLFVVVRP